MKNLTMLTFRAMCVILPGVTFCQSSAVIAQQLKEKADSLFKAQKFEQSNRYFRKAATNYWDNDLLDEFILCKNSEARGYWNQGLFQKCINLSDSLRAVTSGRISTEQQAFLFHNLGIGYNRLAKYDSALANLYVALRASKSGDSRNVRTFSIMRELGVTYQNAGNYDSAEFHLKTSLAANLDYLGSFDLSNVEFYNSLGTFYWELGSYRNTEENYLRALEVLKKNNALETARGISIYFNLGTVLHQGGAYEEAVAYYQFAINGWKEIFGDDYVYLGNAYNNLGIVSRNLSQPSRAIDYFMKAAGIFSKALGSDHLYLSIIYNGIGNSFDDLKKWDSSLLFYAKSLGISKKVYGEAHQRVAISYSGIGATYLQAEKESPGFFGEYAYDSAIFNLSRSLNINLQEFGKKHPSIANNYFNHATAYLQQGDHLRALEYLQLSLTSNNVNFEDCTFHSSPEIEGFLDEILALRTLQNKLEAAYELSVKTKDPKYLILAFENLELLLAFIDELSRRYTSDSDKIQLFDASSEVFAIGLRMATEQYRKQGMDSLLAKAFQFSERNKANILRQNLAKSDAKKFGNVPADLLEEESSLNESIADIRSKILDGETLDKDSLEVILFDKRRTLKELSILFEQKYPSYYQLKYNETRFRPQDYQDQLDDGEAIIEYALGVDSLYIFLISKNRFEVEIKSKKDLLKRIEKYRDHVKSDLERSPNTPVAYELYEQLLKSSIGEDSSLHKLHIIPDQELGYVPFEILHTRANSKLDFRNAPYLLRDYTISYAHSASLWLKSSKDKRDAARKGYLGFSPSYRNEENGNSEVRTALGKFRDVLLDLKFNHQEVESISKSVGGSKFQSEEATEHNFKRNASNHQIIHLAMHALVDGEKPMQSKLLFTQEGDSIEDGYLHTFELYNMELNADLAVLSACNTGYGKLEKGEGIMSLARGFAYAGVPSVVMSHWKVDDESTSQLMIYFYEFLKDGLAKSEALRRAKLKFLETTDAQHTHPFYWGAFVHIGNDDPIYRKSNYWMYPIGFVAVFIAVLAFRRRFSRKS